ncbi:MAG: DNA polymerase III subunit delta [Planctomycetaceae bacterium]|jgi:DNA polymerase-3 subunit delta|nr:DNA polymerase III subunit delta [Planctomycetaceae bacterium]
MKPISIHDFLWEPSKFSSMAIYVVFGNDPFWKFHAVRTLRDQVLADEDAEFSLTRFEGDSVKFIDVLREVTTHAMFGGDRRLVIVEDADSFVTKNRDELEKYTEKPSGQAVLLLLLDSFPSNTRLFKLVTETKNITETCLVIEANSLPEKEIPKWIVRWSKHHHKTTCDPDAAEMIFQRIGAEHGLIDQELAKLALMVIPKEKITTALVEKAVGSWRSQSTFEMLDLALAGQTAAAIRQLDQLLLAGENAVGILAQIAPTLRKFAAATQLILDGEKHGKKISPVTALEQAGVNRYFIEKKSEKQLKMLGRYRGAKLLNWLLQADLDLKGASRNDPRIILETLIINLADPRLRLP